MCDLFVTQGIEGLKNTNHMVPTQNNLRATYIKNTNKITSVCKAKKLEPSKIHSVRGA